MIISRPFNKAILFLMFLSIPALFVSCSTDDVVSVSDRNKSIPGQWEYEAITTDRAVDINGDGTVNIDLFNTQEIRQCLKDNPTLSKALHRNPPFTARSETGRYTAVPWPQFAKGDPNLYPPDKNDMNYGDFKIHLQRLRHSPRTIKSYINHIEKLESPKPSGTKS